MSLLKNLVYALYVSTQAVELCFNEGPNDETARFICAQKNYQSISDCGLNLSKYKGIHFIDHTQTAQTYYGYVRQP